MAEKMIQAELQSEDETSTSIPRKNNKIKSYPFQQQNVPLNELETSNVLIINPQTIQLIVRFTSQDIKNILKTKNGAIHEVDLNENNRCSGLEPRRNAPLPLAIDHQSSALSCPKDQPIEPFTVHLYLESDHVPDYIQPDNRKVPICVFSPKEHKVGGQLSAFVEISKYNTDTTQSVPPCEDENSLKIYYKHLTQRHFDQRVSLFSGWEAVFSCFINFALRIDKIDGSNANIRIEALIPTIDFELFNAQTVSSSSFIEGHKLRRGLDAGVIMKSIENDLCCKDVSACRDLNMATGVWLNLDVECEHYNLIKHPLIYALCSFYKRSVINFHDIVPFQLVVSRPNAPILMFQVSEILVGGKSSNANTSPWSILDYETDISVDKDHSIHNVFAKLRKSNDQRLLEIFHHDEFEEPGKASKFRYEQNSFDNDEKGTPLLPALPAKEQLKPPNEYSNETNQIISNQQHQIISLQNKINQLTDELKTLKQQQHDSCLSINEAQNFDNFENIKSDDKVLLSTNDHLGIQDDCNISSITNPTFSSPIACTYNERKKSTQTKKNRKTTKIMTSSFTNNQFNTDESSNDDEGFTMIRLEAKYLVRIKEVRKAKEEYLISLNLLILQQILEEN